MTQRLFLACVLGFMALGSSRGLAAGGHGPGAKGTLIRGASLVLTMDPSVGNGGLLGRLPNADVLIVGDRIAAVGKLGQVPGARVIDGDGMIVMPGFVDTHDHLWQSVIRGCATDAPVTGWFPRCGAPLFPSKDNPPVYHFSQPDAYAAVRLSTTGLIATGVTTVVDWSHSFGPGFVRGNLLALNDSGLRYAFAMSADTPDGSDVKAVKAELIDPNPLATLQIAGRISNDPDPSKDPLKTATKLAKELHVKLHIHLLESPDAKADASLDLLADAGALALGPDLLTAHTIHISPEEIAKLANAGASVSHQPLSNMRLASGVMPYPEMQAAGIHIGLGLDGGTNDTADVFNNMRAATGLQRAKAPYGVQNAERSPNVEEVLRAATMGGAEVLGMQSTIGSLTPGKQADVIVIDTRAVNFAPVLRPVAQLVFNGQPQNVKWVFVAGRALMEDGQVIGVNERKLIEAAQAASGHIAPLLQP